MILIIVVIVIFVIVVISITLLVFFHSKVKVLAIESGTFHLFEVFHRISYCNLSEIYCLFTVSEVLELIKEDFSKTSYHPFFGLFFSFR